MENTKKRRSRVVGWTALAVCLCLLAGGVYLWQIGAFRSGDASMGGAMGAGMGDPKLSMAVYPAAEKREDVAEANSVSITEAEAPTLEGLGGYLPAALPAGYHWGFGDLRKTTMQDGTVYRQLRVTYRTGDPAPSVKMEDGGETVPSPEALGDQFELLVSSFRSPIRGKHFDAREVTLRDLERLGRDWLHISYGDGACVSIHAGDLDAQELLELVESIGRK